MNFNEHYFTFENMDEKIRSYPVQALWEYTADYPVIDIPIECVISCINTYINNFEEDDWLRVQEADLSYPIIINDVSGIVDGCHRTVKALFLGHTTMRAKRIEVFPETNLIWNSWDEYDNQ